MTHPNLEAPAAPADHPVFPELLGSPMAARGRSWPGLALALGLVGLAFGVCLLPCSAQESAPAENVGPSDADPETRPLSRAEEWRLGIEIRRSADWNLQDLERREVMEKLLGKDRLRRLEGARFQYALRDADPLYDHGLRELSGLDEAEDTVLSAYTKLARETLEDVLGLDQLEERSERWLDQVRSSRSSGSVDEGGSSRSRGLRSSYRVRVSPRLADDYVGVKFKMPYTGTHFFSHLSFRVRYDFDDDRTLYMLKFDDNRRFLHFTYEPDSEDFGDELSLSLRFFW